MAFDHTNENLPSSLIVRREGNTLVLQGRTVRITFDANRWREVVDAISEVMNDHTSMGH